jgi:hypothetical protein
MPIITSPWIDDDRAYVVVDRLLVGTRPKPLRAERNEARRIVREVMADVLDWLGMTVEDERPLMVMIEGLAPPPGSQADWRLRA